MKKKNTKHLRDEVGNDEAEEDDYDAGNDQNQLIRHNDYKSPNENDCGHDRRKEGKIKPKAQQPSTRQASPVLHGNYTTPP